MLIKINRRDFLKGSAYTGALGLFEFCIFRLDYFFLSQLVVLEVKNILIVNLRGGADGLSLCPYYEGQVSDLIKNTLRPNLNISSDLVLKFLPQNGVNDKIGLHPKTSPPYFSATDNNIKIIQQYGNIADDERSHETAQILLSLGQNKLSSNGTGTRGILAKLSDFLDWRSFSILGA